MVAFPGCKINLGLQVLRRRPDGYHDIDTVFYPVPWSDILEFLPAKHFSFSLSGLAIEGDSDDNLCLRAYRLLQKDHSLPPVQGHLHKVVPTGAGLGGGSADAAHTLRILRSLFSLVLSEEQLMELAYQLGSDCSFFLKDSPARGTGRGEVLKAMTIDLKGYFLLVVVPDVHVSTAEAYSDVKPQPPKEDLASVLARPVTQWKDHLTNDFEASVFERFPEIAALKNKMYALGAVFASMSGSGSSVYGLFRDDQPRETHFPGLPGWSGWL